MFKKTVVVDFTGMNEWAKNRLREVSEKVDFYDDLPTDPIEVSRRIGDADCLMVSYNTPITRAMIEAAPNLRYIGMCCTLYTEKSANVDIIAAKERGIVVTGIRDYGDGGVVEFGIAALVYLLHGFAGQQWRESPNELELQKIGIIGMGITGFKLAAALQFLGADIYYTDLVRQPKADAAGMKFMPLGELLDTVDILSTQLPKNSCLLNEAEFDRFGNGKILMNTSIGPTFSVPALKKWLENPGNFYVCDDVAIGSCAEELAGFKNVLYIPKCAASSEQCTRRLSEKSIENVENFLKSETK